MIEILKKNAVVLAGLVAITAGLGLFILTQGRPRKPVPGATILTERFAIPEFSLTDDTGKTVRSSDLQGAWIGAFVFTSCGTTCPMMTAKMKRIRRELPGLGLVSFSVDPGDTPERLAAYKRGLGADWTFLTGGPGVVRKLCIEGFKLPVADSDDPEEPILHSRNLVLVDGENKIVGYFDSDDPVSIKSLLKTAASLL
jgi:protein SCO1/2